MLRFKLFLCLRGMPGRERENKPKKNSFCGETATVGSGRTTRSSSNC